MAPRPMTAALLAILALGADGPGKPAENAPKSAALAEQYRQIIGEYEGAMTKPRTAREKAPSEAEGAKLYAELSRDRVVYERRVIELAEASPEAPATQDALIWILDRGVIESARYGEPFGRAIDLLVEHHAHDPEVARIALRLENAPSRRRDALLDAVYALAEGREAKGLARLALAQYLERKAQGAGRPSLPRTFRFQGRDGQGRPVDRMVTLGNEQIAYRAGLRLLDPDALRRESQRLYEEVIAEYADVPYITRQHQTFAAQIREHPPVTIADPKERERMLKIEAQLARKQTLGEVAEARLDALLNLAIGRPAPEIDGVGLDGKPLKLSDYRGKVVALVFWGSWCGPCMAEVPYERELAERLKGKPFALLGVDCDGDKAAALKAVEAERMVWPHWHDGAPGEGPIVKRYRIQGYPSVFVLDARGIIRHKGHRGEFLGRAVDSLLTEMESKDAARPAAPDPP